MKVLAVELDDVYDADDGRVVVLAGQEVFVVSPVAWAFLEAARGRPTTLEEITERLVESFGAPPEPADAASFAEAIAGELAERDLVVNVSEG